MSDDANKRGQHFIHVTNATRLANFLMLQSLYLEVARSKGAAGEAWLREMRDNALRELDAIRDIPAENGDADMAIEAELAREAIGTTFAMALHRLSER